MLYPKIAVIIAALNEEKYITQCLDSIINQSYPGEIEIIVADGGSIDATKEIIKNYELRIMNYELEKGKRQDAQSIRKIVLLVNKKKYQSAGRNLAIIYTDCKFAAYLDAHSYADKDWLRELYDTFAALKKNELKLAGVGSIYLNSDNSSFCRASDIAIKSVLCGSTKNTFHNASEISKTDNCYAVLYHLEICRKAGLYNESLQSAEDIELNHRLTKCLGYDLYVNPMAVTYYFRPNNLFKLFRQQLKYGFWRIKGMKLLKKTEELGVRCEDLGVESCKSEAIVSYKPLMPAMFIIALMFFTFLGLISQVFYLVAIIIVLMYLGTVLFFSCYVGIKRRCNILYLFIIYITIHLSYCLGSIFAMLKSKIY